MITVKLLLSIKPEYVAEILSGRKKFEYRKRVPQKPVDTIIIYSTHPQMKIVGEVKINAVLKSSPTHLWEETKKSAGISRAKYREYFKGCKNAYAFELGDIELFLPERDLIMYGVLTAPQSFMYIDENDIIEVTNYET